MSKAASNPGVPTEPGPIVVETPPPYSIQMSIRPPPRRSPGRPRPGISTWPSIRIGASSGGQIITKAPPPNELTPGSVTAETSAPASAASTAFPPTFESRAPASAASAQLDATAITECSPSEPVHEVGHEALSSVLILRIEQDEGMARARQQLDVSERVWPTFFE